MVLDNWLTEHEAEIKRWLHMLSDFKTSTSHEFAKFSVALREPNLLQLNCRTVVNSFIIVPRFEILCEGLCVSFFISIITACIVSV